jgi:hypothetical protein
MTKTTNNMKKTTITLDPKAQVHGNGKNLYAVSVSNIDDDFGEDEITLQRANSEDDIRDQIFNEYGHDDDEDEESSRDEFFENWQIAITFIGKVS